MGKSAIVGVDDLGKLHRSTNGGTTWTVDALALRPGESVASIAADRTGRALLLIHPQRLLQSRDDGATWTPLETPGIGAREVLRDAAGALWLVGNGVSAKLGDPWVLGDLPAPGPLGKSAPDNKTRVLAGERIVTVQSEKTAAGYRIALRSEALGATPSDPFVIGEMSEIPSSRFTGSGSVIVGELHENETTRVVRTTDDGRTWETLGTFPGVRPPWHNLIAAPGWVALGDLCEKDNKNCTGSRVKVGPGEWQALAIPAHSRLTAIVHDAARDRMLVVINGNQLYRATPHDATLTEAGLELPEAIAMTGASIAADGSVRIVVEDIEGRWKLVRIAADWKTKTEAELPFHPDAIDLAGERGLAFAKHRAWETSDGGDHWVDVGAAQEDQLQCATTGCLVGDAVRIGWEGTGVETAKVPKSAPKTEAAGRSFACVASGAWKKKLAGEVPYAWNHALPGDVRYLGEPPRDIPRIDDRSITVARGGEPPKMLTLLSAIKAGTRTVRRWSLTTANGYVLVRYAFEPATVVDDTKKYSPVDVELGWYSAHTGKTSRAKLAALPPFRVGSGAPSALTAIVDGGLLFMPFGGDAPLRFLRDDGKIETIPRPTKLTSALPPDTAFRDGPTVVLAATDGPDVTLQITTDAGKTWKEVTWTIGRESSLVTHKSKPALFVTERVEDTGSEEKPIGVLPFATATADPPALITYDAGAVKTAVEALTPCATLTGFRVSYPGASRIKVKVTSPDATATLTASNTYALVSDSGACLAAIVASEAADADEPMHAVIAPHDLAHSWLLRGASDNPFEHQARTMSCKLE